MYAMLIGAGLVMLGVAVAIHHRRTGHRAMLACALRRLRATEAQKQEITAVVEDVQGRMRSVKERTGAIHGELADILASPAVDGQRLEALEARLFEAMGEGSQAIREAVSRLHGTLEPRQRQQAADWVRRAGHHRHHCHGACHC